jgi:hypothetical protein
VAEASRTTCLADASWVIRLLIGVMVRAVSGKSGHFLATRAGLVQGYSYLSTAMICSAIRAESWGEIPLSGLPGSASMPSSSGRCGCQKGLLSIAEYAAWTVSP